MKTVTHHKPCAMHLGLSRQLDARVRRRAGDKLFLYYKNKMRQMSLSPLCKKPICELTRTVCCTPSIMRGTEQLGILNARRNCGQSRCSLTRLVNWNVIIFLPMKDPYRYVAYPMGQILKRGQSVSWNHTLPTKRPFVKWSNPSANRSNRGKCGRETIGKIPCTIAPHR